MFKEEVIVDCHNHMLGRVAATVAKELLSGQRVTLLRCEKINISGSLYRNKLKYEAFLRKKSNTNPRRSSHIHYRAPSKIVWRTIRGMIPHKTPHGALALSRLQVFEGIPPSYEKKKRLVIPNAIRAICLKSHRSYCVLGDMASRVGWKHDELVKRLEDKRRVRSAAYYEKKMAERSQLKQRSKVAFKELSSEDQEILTLAGKN